LSMREENIKPQGSDPDLLCHSRLQQESRLVLENRFEQCICRYEELTKANTLPAPTQCVIHAAREVISAFFMQLISKEDPLAVRATIRMQLRPAVFFVGHAR
jgi:hypothetical protein